ncbi:MAG: TonB C-terminal domain-containing protein [Deltaproteobacteria bacterium]|nr:TonB C-terminal domain-containing protein [Deltaproteobacteria bacterium]
MESSRKQRWRQLQSAVDPGLRWMLLVSLLLHLLLPILYQTLWFPTKERVRPTVYRVNLVNKPVKNPQAGRPEAVLTKKKKSPPKVKLKSKPPKPLPPKPKPPKAKPKAKPVPVKAKSRPAPKPVIKSKPVVKPKPAVSEAQETALQRRLQQLRDKQRQEQAEKARQAKLDMLRAAVAAESRQVESPVRNAPVGSVTGKGDQVGVDERDYVREFITQQWRLSRYQLNTRNLEAEVVLVYSTSGKLLHYRFERKSGNEVFDSSLLRAILKSKDLGQPLQQQTEFDVTFNLKDMLDKP